MPRRDTAAPPAQTAPRRALAAALLLSLGGLVIAGVLIRLHFRAHAGFISFCAINEHLNCDTVALSPYSVVLGVPVAAWGALGYALAAALSALGLRRGKPHASWPTGLLFLVAAFAVAVSAALAVVSEVVIRSFCIMCLASWATAVALLVAAWAACRPAGVAAAVSADLRLLRARPALALGTAVALLAVAGVAGAAYPRYWDHKALPVVRPAPAPGGITPVRTTPPAPGSERVIHEFSDFECPFCAIAHDQMKALTASTPGLRVVSRHFPLDSACNPALNRRMHENACDYARASICAEGMGKGEAMDDALFANQKTRRPLAELVKELGLDAARFDACVSSRETAERLDADVKEGMRLGVRATPSFVLNGQVHSGRIPVELLR
jgi:protein-disulfide isomerase